MDGTLHEISRRHGFSGRDLLVALFGVLAGVMATAFFCEQRLAREPGAMPAVLATSTAPLAAVPSPPVLPPKKASRTEILLAATPQPTQPIASPAALDEEPAPPVTKPATKPVTPPEAPVAAVVSPPVPRPSWSEPGGGKSTKAELPAPTALPAPPAKPVETAPVVAPPARPVEAAPVVAPPARPVETAPVAASSARQAVVAPPVPGASAAASAVPGEVAGIAVPRAAEAVAVGAGSGIAPGFPPVRPGRYLVLAGSYTPENSRMIAAGIASKGVPVRLKGDLINGQAVVHVQLGPFVDRASADAARFMAQERTGLELITIETKDVIYK